MAGAYNDVAPGPPPVRLPHTPVLALSLAILMATTFLAGTAGIWVLSIGRLLRADTPLRQQLAWLLCAAIPLFVIGVLGPPDAVFVPLTLAIPIAIAVGVLRYGMLGIEFVLRRGLVFVLLTAAILGVYVSIAAAAGARLSSHPAVVALMVALIAVALSPLRSQLQLVIDRFLYGERGDPLRALLKVGDTVATTSEPEGLLPSVLATVTRAVHAPGARVSDVEGTVFAQYGEIGESESVLLRMQGRDVGTLDVGRRTPGEAYSVGDRRLLAALAQQVAVVVRAQDLAEALEAERDHALDATRSERARLRRDLHDGLGPFLSGVALGLGAVETRLEVGDQSGAAGLIARMREEAGLAVTDIRHILDDLRPTALDGASLPTALQRYVESVGTVVPIEMHVSPSLGTLDPHIESQAFRIAQEAVTNAVRHAFAALVSVRLDRAEGWLRLEIQDDGEGFGLGHHGGVGVESMRHRAQSSGGTLTISTGGGGTTVLALLPAGGDT
jgi:signal transduction histidine kinase